VSKMSDYGLVTGEAGNIQFDTNRKVIGAWEYGSISNWVSIPTFPSTHGYRHTFDYNCNIIGIAVRPNTSTLVGTRIDRVPAWEYDGSLGIDPNWPGVGGRGNIFVSSPTTIEYAIYSPDAEGRTIPSWGLITYNENQEIVFNSGLRHLKIREIIEVNRTPLVTWDNEWFPGPGTVTFNHNTPDPFYIIPNNYMFMSYQEFRKGRLFYGMCVIVIGIKKISSTSAKLERLILYQTKAEYLAKYGPEPPTIDVPNPLRIAVCVL